MITPEGERALRERGDIQITTVGRKTGRPHTVTVSYTYHEGAVYCLAGKEGRVDWYRNILKNPNVMIRAGGRSFVGRAEPMTDREGAATFIMDLLTQRYGKIYVSTWYQGTSRAPLKIVVLGMGEP